MIKCRTCGAEIATSAKFCPKCGETESMKAIADFKGYAALVFLVVLIIIFVKACF